MKLFVAVTVILTFICIFVRTFSSPVKVSSPVIEMAKTFRSSRPVIIRGAEDPDPEVQKKRDFIKTMMKDAWDEYVKYAWGDNELRPISQTGRTGGIYGDSKIGATIIDALDTLYIMGYDEEFKKGRDWIDENFNFEDVDSSVSVFETNIRIVGGFLTAYTFTNDVMFLQKAHQVATRLLPAFETRTGIPYGYVNPKTGHVQMSSSAILSEFGTLHLEFLYLSELTGDPIFKEKVLKIRKVLKDAHKPNGLYWNYMSPETGKFTNDHVSIGALGDSFYEYLLKAWVQLGDAEARQMYDDAMNAFVKNDLVRVSKQSHLLYIAEEQGGFPNDVSSHLACFAGGLFALGSVTDPNNPGNRERDMEIGRNFTNTCHESYIRTQTRIGPEIFRFTNDAEAEGISTADLTYILRPEVIESYFVLYRLTGDSKYREWAWDAAQAIEKYCKISPGRGYSGIRNVNNAENPGYDDIQETFFLAETLKYLYLIFSSKDLIDLNQWVFNTECHPLPIKGSNSLY